MLEELEFAVKLLEKERMNYMIGGYSEQLLGIPAFYY